MIERLRLLLRRKSASEKLAEQSGYPLELTEMLNKMARGEIPPKVILTEIDTNGRPNITLIDVPKDTRGRDSTPDVE